jgi:hypothetical protein
MITQSSTLVQKIRRLVNQRAAEFGNLSFLLIEGPEDSVKNEIWLPYEVVEALKDCLEAPREILHEATMTVLTSLTKFKVTDAQVSALLDFLSDPQMLEISIRWRMELIFRRDGSIDTDLGMVDIIFVDGSWRVRYDSKQSDLGEAIRTAAVIAATLPQRD